MRLPAPDAKTVTVHLRVPLRVLLVEDSHVLAERLTETLRALQGISLVAVTNTESATLALLEHESVDVVILDLHLKQGTGFGVMRKLSGVSRHPTIIVLTNYDLPEYKSAALGLGATHFLDKAHDYDQLPELLRKIYNSRLAATS